MDWKKWNELEEFFNQLETLHSRAEEKYVFHKELSEDYENKSVELDELSFIAQCKYFFQHFSLPDWDSVKALSMSIKEGRAAIEHLEQMESYTKTKINIIEEKQKMLENT